MKLTLMLMGGSALLLLGILGIYFGAGGETMNLLDIARLHIPVEWQRVFFPLTFVGFGVLGRSSRSTRGRPTATPRPPRRSRCSMRAC